MMVNNSLILRRTTAADLETLFVFQLDAEANRQAAFTPRDPTDQAAYLQKHTQFLADPTIRAMTVLVDGGIVGSVAKFEVAGDAEITYWIDRKFWGQGIATRAVASFLAIETTRPLFGRVVFDGIGSQHVLEKCGFVRIGTDRGFANARQTEVEEFIYRLG